MIKKTLCAVLHYGSKKLTVECLKSLIKNNPNTLDVLLIDNDPKQDFKLPKWSKYCTKIIKTGGNKGFARANNFVTKKINNSHHSILFLNNDTIIKPRAIKTLREVLNKKNVGSVGPCIYYHSNRKKIWACGGKINKIRLLIHGKYSMHKNKKYYEVDYLPAAAFLCRPELWKSIKGFSENYFFAYEEAQFAMEVKKRKFKNVVAPKSEIIHHVGLSSKITAGLLYNEIRNRMSFAKYMYGKILGTIYASLITIDVIFRREMLKYTLINIKVWFYALVDEFLDKPVTNKKIKLISMKYCYN